MVLVKVIFCIFNGTKHPWVTNQTPLKTDMIYVINDIEVRSEDGEKFVVLGFVGSAYVYPASCFTSEKPSAPAPEKVKFDGSVGTLPWLLEQHPELKEGDSVLCTHGWWDIFTTGKKYTLVNNHNHFVLIGDDGTKWTGTARKAYPSDDNFVSFAKCQVTPTPVVPNFRKPHECNKGDVVYLRHLNDIAGEGQDMNWGKQARLRFDTPYTLVQQR